MGGPRTRERSGAAPVAERSPRRSRARDGARVRAIPHTAYQRYREELERAGDVAANRVEHRPGSAIHPHQRNGGRRLYRFAALCEHATVRLAARAYRLSVRYSVARRKAPTIRA